MNARWLAVAACAVIVLLDWSQPLVFEWRTKFVGAIAGGVLYLLAAFAIARQWRPAAVVVALMPVIPLTTLTLWAVGLDLPVRPDAPMVVVLGVQIVAAAAAGRFWWETRPSA